MQRSALTLAVVQWYAAHARDLPWRRDPTPWGVMVSEFMLQQTPVSRVVDPWHTWMQRWPTPAALATESPGEAVRAWGRLGYPRRALRLHAAATTIVEHHGGRVPEQIEALRALPGVGEYTAAAIATFAFGGRHIVLDVNVRRVLARLDGGQDTPVGAPTAAERRRAEEWLPDEDLAPLWSVAAMELGAQLCRATNPRCPDCPVRDSCRWLAAGHPAGAPRRRQAYAGTDRAARGHILAALRARPAGAPPAPVADVVRGWPDPAQAQRAIDTLVADGLVHTSAAGVAL